jgi:opacity protein-like surface antigen
LGSAIAGAGGWAILAEQVDDPVYIQFGIDGSTVTNFEADYAEGDINVVIGNNFAVSTFYAWFVYNKSTALGVHSNEVITVLDSANFRLANTVLLDNTTSTNIYQTDNRRIFRVDETYPVRFPTTGGGGLDIVWRNTILTVATGSGVTAQDRIDIASSVWANSSGSQVSVDVTSIKERTTNLPDDPASNSDIGEIPANVWDEIIDGTKNQSAREKLRKIATKTQDIALR